MEKFIPKKTEKDIISIRINSDLLNKVDEVAASTDISRNELIVQCIEFALDNIERYTK